jgi:quaternary ammonium compound-resistance protein SugE
MQESMYIYLTVLAALLFGASGYLMKLSDGMSKPIPTIGFCLMLLLGGLLLTVALQQSSLGKTYVIVVGLESVTTFFLAAFMLGEQMTPFKMVATGVVMGGVLALQLAD